MDHHHIEALLRRELQPALGCTGPTAYALAAACCGRHCTGRLERLTVSVSPAFLKIGFGVATPGTDRPGIAVAAALGYVGGDWRRGLQVLEPCGPAETARAEALADAGLVRVRSDPERSGIYIRAEAVTDRETALAVVEGTHDGVTLIRVDGRTVYEAPPAGEAEDGTGDLALPDIFSFVRTAPAERLDFLPAGYRMNLLLAEDGLRGSFGLGSGRAHLRRAAGGGLPPDWRDRPLDFLPRTLPERIRVLVSAASDARMGGSRLPAMAAMGDGNQGITATLPVGAAAEHLGASREEMSRALALSCLTLFYVKGRIGRVGAFCMCAMGAAAGAAAGIGYLYGLDDGQIRAAVKNALAPLTGMLCDGAKNGCALKMAAAADTALSAAALAAEGVEPGYWDGVAADTLEDTVACVSRIAVDTMAPLDAAMVDAILAKQDAGRKGP